MFKNLENRSVKVSGDGQMDSPGHSAKNCIYTLIKVDSNYILHVMARNYNRGAHHYWSAITPQSRRRSAALPKNLVQNGGLYGNEGCKACHFLFSFVRSEQYIFGEEKKQAKKATGRFFEAERIIECRNGRESVCI